MRNIDELVHRIGLSNAALGADIGQILRLGPEPKPQRMSDEQIIEAAKRAVSHWLSPTHGRVSRDMNEDAPKWTYIWNVARAGEGGSIMLNPSELNHVMADDPYLHAAVMESSLPEQLRMPFEAFIFRAELHPPSWRMFFRMVARGAMPLVLTCTDRDFDTINILVG